MSNSNGLAVSRRRFLRFATAAAAVALLSSPSRAASVSVSVAGSASGFNAGSFLVMGFQAAPYVKVYDVSPGGITDITAGSTFEFTSTVTGISFSHDGVYLAAYSGPVTIYKRSGGDFLQASWDLDQLGREAGLLAR